MVEGVSHIDDFASLCLMPQSSSAHWCGEAPPKPPSAPISDNGLIALWYSYS